MKKLIGFIAILILLSCNQKHNSYTAQDIVDQSIAASGGDLYKSSTIHFRFRDRTYSSEPSGNQKSLKRLFANDTIRILDIKAPADFKRFVNDSLVSLSDSLTNVYSNSVNSVHYFAYLPFGLNDKAVRKELIGEITIKNKDYYKVKVTFDQEGGGEDFEDIYVYWFNKETFKPDYLAYEFHIDGGGIRFREAYNERYVNGIRFVDYNNYSPVKGRAVVNCDSLFIKQELKLLSKIALEEIRVIPNG